MTPRERMIAAMSNRQPDHVPACPDLFEMVPVRLSGKPSWHSLVYEDPPIWKLRMDAAAHFGVDAFIALPTPFGNEPATAVVHRDGDRIITRAFTETPDGVAWSPDAIVYNGMEPSAHVKARAIGLPDSHEDYEVVQRKYTKLGRDIHRDAVDYVGDRGVVAPIVYLPVLSCWPEDTYAYFDDPEARAEQSRRAGEHVMKMAETFLSWKPDVLMIGNSGMMLFNPVPIFRHLGLEWLQKVTRLAKEHGVPTILHCCGPEKDLVEIAANESDLNCIEPLEVPPMGDCILKELKGKFGRKIALKGNLHTTRTMLMGTVAEVEDACRKAIDDAAEGGGFILSTGDQTPRDAPEENIIVMQRIAETYGRY